MPKQSQRQLRAVDAIGVLRETFVPKRQFSAELTAKPLASYFKEGGSSLRCDVIVDYGIAMLLGHRSETATLEELAKFKNPRMLIEGGQIVRAMAAQYRSVITSCVKVPRKWIRLRNGLGIWLPAAIKIIRDGRRCFVIVQPRRSCDAVKRHPELLLSLFSFYHAIEDDRHTPTEILDLQCAKGAIVRPRRVIKIADTAQLNKADIDRIFSIYADSMQLILQEPKRYGISEEWAKSAQTEFEFAW